MKRKEQDQLLSELFAGEPLDDLRRTSLQSGLVAVQRRRFRRRAAQACVIVGLAGICAGLAVGHRANTPKQLAHARTPEPQAKTPSMAESPIRVISDEELFALFPDRPLALVGKPGQQQLVFLDGRPH